MTIQVRFVPDMCRSLPMNGRAMLAIVASRTTISWAMQISTRAQPRCCAFPSEVSTSGSGAPTVSVRSDMDFLTT